MYTSGVVVIVALWLSAGIGLCCPACHLTDRLSHIALHTDVRGCITKTTTWVPSEKGHFVRTMRTAS